MRNFINIVENASVDHSGSWILPSGEIRYCDHNGGIHHADLALEEFGDNIDLEGEDDYTDNDSDAAIYVALDEGWVQVSFLSEWDGLLTLIWRQPLRAAQKKSLSGEMKTILPCATKYSVDAQGKTFTTTDQGEFSVALEHAFRGRDFTNIFESGQNDLTISHFDDSDDGLNCISVHATLDGKFVGEGKFDIDGGFFRNIEILPEYRRMGVASAIYDYVESLGHSIQPSPLLTADGAAFWKKRTP